MTVLVTGGAGYIGSHTARELIDAGKKVVVIDNLSRGHRQSVVGVEFVFGDIHDKDFLSGVIRKCDISSVIHFAADSQVGESMTNPSKYYNNNVIGSIKLLDAVVECGVKNIVFSSSAAVYGNPDIVPISELADLKPANVYGRTKLMIENAIKDYSSSYGLNYMILRYFNAAGAHEIGDIGEDHNPETHLIPIALQAALGKRDKVSIYGDDYKTKDGTCIRDYIHVSDLAKAHLLALDALEKGAASNIYNLGSSNGFSVYEIIAEIEKVTGITIHKEIAERRVGDPDILIADSSKIRKELDWTPKYSLQDIVGTAWKWHKNNPHGYEGK